MRSISVYFADFMLGFNPLHNLFIDILKKYYKVEISKNPDFLFYSCYGSEFLKFHDCIRVFYTYENVRPDFNFCDYACGFDRLTFGDRYIRHNMTITKPELINGFDYVNRKFANFIYSNDNPWEGCILRKEFYKSLSRYKHIDSPGKVLNNMLNAISPRHGNWSDGKLEFIKNYKFTIAFENFSYPGYITEKLLHPLSVNSVPIYWGDPHVTKDFNPDSFINIHDFRNFDEAIEYIIYIDNDNDAYLKMLTSPAMHTEQAFEPTFEEWLINIIENGKSYTRNFANKSFIKPYFSELMCLHHIHDKILQPLLDYNKVVSFTSYYDLFCQHQSCIYNNLMSTLMPLSISLKKLICSYRIMHDNMFDNFSESKISEQRYFVFKSAVDREVSCPIERRVKFIKNSNLENDYRQLLMLLWPYDVIGKDKIRMGGKEDGCSILLNINKNHGIVWSVGVSTKPGAKKRDFELAKLGYKVIQFDDKYKTSPMTHNNIEFYYLKEKYTPNFVKSKTYLIDLLSSMIDLEVNFDIILCMDIEGKEWDFFENLSYHELMKFVLISVEFHGLTKNDCISKYKQCFEKIRKTHCPIHFHYNNCGPVIGFSDFLLSDVLEVTFARNNIGCFSPSFDTYPTILDYPCIERFPDLYIGKFNIITRQ